MAFEDEINYEKISQLTKKERKSSKLVTLDSQFYSTLIAYLKKLQEEYNKKYLEAPTSTQALLLNNEICKLDSMIKEIYARRERKVILSALDTHSEPKLNQMLEHEQRLYKTLTKVLDDFRDEVLYQKPNPSCAEILKSATVSTLTTDSKTQEPRPEAESGVKPEAELESTKESKPESEPKLKPKREPLDMNDQVSAEENSLENESFIEDDSSLEDEGFLENKGSLENERSFETDKNQAPSPSTADQEVTVESDRLDLEHSEVEVDQEVAKESQEQVMVYIEENIEPFVGIDLITYNLHKEDLVTIPKPIADILLKNKKARVVETNI